MIGRQSLTLLISLGLLSSHGLIAENEASSPARKRQPVEPEFIAGANTKTTWVQQEIVHANQALDLDQCLHLAYKQNPGYLSILEAVTASGHDEAVALKEMYPKLDLELTGDESLGRDDSFDSYDLSTVITQPIFRGGALYRGWQVAKLTSQQVALDEDRQSQGLGLQVKLSWYNLVASNQLLHEEQAAVNRLETLAEHAAKFFEEGMVWKSDVLEAEVNVARGEQEVVRAERRLDQAKAGLNTLLHRSVSGEFAISEELEMPGHQWTYDKAVQEALVRRPDLRRQVLAVQKSEKSVDIAKSDYYPSVTGKFSWSSDADEFHRSAAREGSSVELSVDWNLFSWGQTGRRVSSARARQRQIEYQLQAVRDRVILDVRSAWLLVEETSKRAEILEDALKKSAENYDVNVIRYQEQIGTARDVLESQDLLTRTKKDYIRAVQDYVSALAQLDFAIGREEQAYRYDGSSNAF